MHVRTYRYENFYFQLEFQTFDFVMYKLVTIVITTYVLCVCVFFFFVVVVLLFLPITCTVKPPCTEMLSECKKQVLHCYI